VKLKRHDTVKKRFDVGRRHFVRVFSLSHHAQRKSQGNRQ